jgi:hypothetical protein
MEVSAFCTATWQITPGAMAGRPGLASKSRLAPFHFCPLHLSFWPYQIDTKYIHIPRGVDDQRSGYYALATPSQNSKGC